MTYHYFSLQYSAIQKTVLRHNRLWSIAGISQGLAKLNEIDFIRIAEKDHGGKVLVAGGGKFTAKFANPEKAESARKAITKLLATSFPMLEFQHSAVVEAADFAAAKEQRIVEQLNDQKRGFRGYGTSYLPYLAVCEECGEYPAERRFKIREKYLCRTCYTAWDCARVNFEELSRVACLTTLHRIYADYLNHLTPSRDLEPVYDFKDLFPDAEGNGKEARQRMAVWFSDLNNMNNKVPIWLAQPEGAKSGSSDDIPGIFNKVKEVNIAVVATALNKTFVAPEKRLPFRLVVAGGDDLCLVMPEEYILDFVSNLDQAVREKIKELDKDHNNPLNMDWLNNHAEPDRNGKKRAIGPYSFGGSFIVTSIHTPFKRIHEIGEERMKAAKNETNRLGNSVDWRIMAENEAISDTLLDFERPLIISREENNKICFDDLSLEDYLDLRRKFSAISSSHRYAIISKLIELRQQEAEGQFENWLKCYDSGEADKGFSALLTEPRLRWGWGRGLKGELVPARIATLFELLGIKTSDTRSTSHA